MWKVLMTTWKRLTKRELNWPITILAIRLASRSGDLAVFTGSYSSTRNGRSSNRPSRSNSLSSDKTTSLRPRTCSIIGFSPAQRWKNASTGRRRFFRPLTDRPTFRTDFFVKIDFLEKIFGKNVKEFPGKKFFDHINFWRKYRCRLSDEHGERENLSNKLRGRMEIVGRRWRCAALRSLLVQFHSQWFSPTSRAAFSVPRVNDRSWPKFLSNETKWNRRFFRWTPHCHGAFKA